jgi:hypothetical protein
VPAGCQGRRPWPDVSEERKGQERTRQRSIRARSAYSPPVADVTIPSQFELMWPTLEALKRLGGSGHIDEIVEAVVDAEGFTEEQQEVRRGPGDRMSKIEYHLARRPSSARFASRGSRDSAACTHSVPTRSDGTGSRSTGSACRPGLPPRTNRIVRPGRDYGSEGWGFESLRARSPRIAKALLSASPYLLTCSQEGSGKSGESEHSWVRVGTLTCGSYRRTF